MERRRGGVGAKKNMIWQLLLLIPPIPSSIQLCLRKLFQNFHLAFEECCYCGQAVVGSRQVKACATLVVASCQWAETNILVREIISCWDAMWQKDDIWQIEGDLAPQASSMRMLSKSSLQAATYNGMSTLGTSDKYPSFDFSPPDPLIMLLASQAHVANKVRCLARAKGRQKYDKGGRGAGNRGGAIPTTWLAGGRETWDSINTFLSCCL